MPQICFARYQCYAKDIMGSETAHLDAFIKSNQLSPDGRILPGTAYSLDFPDPQTPFILHKINSMPGPERRAFARSAYMLGDEIHSLAGFFEENLSPVMFVKSGRVAGAGTTAVNTRVTEFQKAMSDYQREVKALWSRRLAPSAEVRAQKLRVRNAFRTMERVYPNELKLFSPLKYRAKNRGNALGSADRAITLALRKSNSPTMDARLNITDMPDIRKLQSCSKILVWAGNAAILADAGFRVAEVNAIRNEGGDWMRESAIQLTGFGSGGAAGGYVGKYTIVGGTALAAKAGLVVAGPVGWAVVGVIVAAGLFAGLGAGYYAERVGRYVASWTWNRSK